MFHLSAVTANLKVLVKPMAQALAHASLHASLDTLLHPSLYALLDISLHPSIYSLLSSLPSSVAALLPGSICYSWLVFVLFNYFLPIWGRQKVLVARQSLSSCFGKELSERCASLFVGKEDARR